MRNQVDRPLRKEWKSKRRLSLALWALVGIGAALHVVVPPDGTLVFAWMFILAGLIGQCVIFDCPSCGRGVARALTADYCHRCGFHLKTP